MKMGKCGTFRPFLEIDRKGGIEETDRKGEREFIRRVITEYLAVVS